MNFRISGCGRFFPSAIAGYGRPLLMIMEGWERAPHPLVHPWWRAVLAAI